MNIRKKDKIQFEFDGMIIQGICKKIHADEIDVEVKESKPIPGTKLANTTSIVFGVPYNSIRRVNGLPYIRTNVLKIMGKA